MHKIPAVNEMGERVYICISISLESVTITIDDYKIKLFVIREYFDRIFTGKPSV